MPPYSNTTSSIQTELASMVPGQSIELTIIESGHGNISKSFTIDPVTSVVKGDASTCLVIHGVAYRWFINSASQLANNLSKLESRFALATGTLLPDLPAQVRIITRENLSHASTRANEGPQALAYTAPCADGVPQSFISRTRDFFTYGANQAALLIADIDLRGCPPEIRDRVQQAGGAWNLLAQVFPFLQGVFSVVRGSTSAGLWRTDLQSPEWVSAGLNQHGYIGVADASDIPRTTKALHTRLWNMGMGWAVVDKGGRISFKSLIDTGVALPEHLAFEGAPQLGEGLQQDPNKRAPIACEGPLLDTAKVVSPLMAEELTEYERRTQAEKIRLKPKREAEQQRFIEEKATKRAKANGRTEPNDADRRQASRWCSEITYNNRHYVGLLAEDVPLVFIDPEFTGHCVGHVLTAPAKYDRAVCADPLEGPTYGRQTAMVMLDDAGYPFINSFAHGSGQYLLRWSPDSLRKWLDETGADCLATYMKFMGSTDLTPTDEIEIANQIETQTKKTSKKITAAQVRRLAKEQQQKLTADANRQHIAATEAGRPTLYLPSINAETLPVCRQLDQFMVQGNMPTLRNASGRPCEIRQRIPTGIHLLGDLDAAPPPVLLITEHTETTLIHEVERRVQCLVRKKGDDWSRAALFNVFANSYFQWRDSTAPQVHVIQTLPLVLPAPRLHAPDGIDAAMHIFFQIDPLVREYLPDPSACNAEMAKISMTWLHDVWLKGVATDFRGKSVAVALALSIIERGLFPERPGFLINSHRAEVGKTTLLHMISIAVRGVAVGAYSWAPDETERRKAMLSALVGGPDLVVWDNLQNGQVLQSPTLDLVLTSTELTGRVLGTIDQVYAPTVAIQAFTGNNIKLDEDTATRVFELTMVMDELNPRDVPGRYDDPKRWTYDHRREILRHLYTILLANSHTRDTGHRTRFPVWWRMVGAAVEDAANAMGRGTLSFDAMALETVENSDKQVVQETILATLLAIVTNSKTSETAHKTHQPFTAKDLHKLCDVGFFEINSTPDTGLSAPPWAVKVLRQYLLAETNRERSQILPSPKSIGTLLKRMTEFPVAFHNRHDEVQADEILIDFKNQMGKYVQCSLGDVGDHDHTAVLKLNVREEKGHRSNQYWVTVDCRPLPSSV
jgi:hypothetical protein